MDGTNSNRVIAIDNGGAAAHEIELFASVAEFVCELDLFSTYYVIQIVV